MPAEAPPYGITVREDAGGGALIFHGPEATLYDALVDPIASQPLPPDVARRIALTAFESLGRLRAVRVRELGAPDGERRALIDAGYLPEPELEGDPAEPEPELADDLGTVRRRLRDELAALAKISGPLTDELAAIARDLADAYVRLGGNLGLAPPASATADVVPLDVERAALAAWTAANEAGATTAQADAAADAVRRVGTATTPPAAA